MVLQDLLAGGVEYVQDSQPSDADAGEIWLDTSVDPSALKIYDASSDVWDEAQASNLDAPVSNIQNELQSGRTRELLLLLQDKPVPEVVDPLNEQSSLSIRVKTDTDGDYVITDNAPSSTLDNFDFSNGGSISDFNGHGVEINPNAQTSEVSGTLNAGSSYDSYTYDVYIIDESSNELARETGLNYNSSFSLSVNLSAGSNYYLLAIIPNDGAYYGEYAAESYPITSDSFDITAGAEETTTVNDRLFAFGEITVTESANNGYVTDKFAAPTTAPTDFKAWNAIQARDVTAGGSTSANPVEFDILPPAPRTTRDDDDKSLTTTGKNGIVINPNKSIDTLSVKISNANGNPYSIDSITVENLSSGALMGSTTGTFNSGDIVTFNLDATLQTGVDYVIYHDSSSSENLGNLQDPSYPYTGKDVDIVDGYENGSTNTTAYIFVSVIKGELTEPINSTRIPKARIADEPFTVRNRVYSESAGSNGQSNFTIATTGGGGHFGIPILTVVSVKKNGSVLDSANWSFDGTDTVTIDTSSVTIASGDTIDIKYDFDVFDSTLQLRAYLSREDTSETSPSISHFRYEYVI